MTTPTEPILTITMDDALCALRAVVAEKGEDYIYKAPEGGPTTTCVYVWKVDGQLQPQCIVGYALAHLGVPLASMGDSLDNSVNAQALARSLAEKGYIITDDAASLLRSAQIVQDAAMLKKSDDLCGCESCQEKSDSTWGAALRRAEARAVELASRTAPSGTAPVAPDTTTAPAEDAGA